MSEQGLRDQLAKMSDDELRGMFLSSSSSSSKQPTPPAEKMLSLDELLNAPVSNIFELRVGQADILRGAGNSRYREGDIETAVRLYERALKHCSMDDERMSAETLKLKEKMFAGRDPLYLNLARCYIKQGRLRDGVNAAKSVGRASEKEAVAFPVPLELQFKALLLQARGSVELGEYDQAAAILRRCPDQSHNEVMQLLRACKTRAAEDGRKLRDQWRGALSSSSDSPPPSSSRASNASQELSRKYYAILMLVAAVAVAILAIWTFPRL